MIVARRPVFFTSVPKCGKNLVYSFYFALGLRRCSWGEAPARLHAAHFARVSDAQNYAFADVGPVSEADEAATIDDVVSQLAALPADVVAHHHFLPAPRLLRFVAESGMSTVFVLRDPRDVLVSMLNYSRERALPGHVASLIAPLSDEDALVLLLEGGGRLVPFAIYFDAYHDWLSAPGVSIFRFEDLIGSRGGGDESRQDEACQRLAALAGFTANDPAIASAKARMFNEGAGTFHKGQIGAWRNAFTPVVRQAYDRHAGWLAERWGYESGIGESDHAGGR
jgi:hypothetical protein